MHGSMNIKFISRDSTKSNFFYCIEKYKVCKENIRGIHTVTCICKFYLCTSSTCEVNYFRNKRRNSCRSWSAKYVIFYLDLVPIYLTRLSNTINITFCEYPLSGSLKSYMWTGRHMCGVANGHSFATLLRTRWESFCKSNARQGWLLLAYRQPHNFVGFSPPPKKKKNLKNP